MPSDNTRYTTISFMASKLVFTVVIGMLFFMFKIEYVGEDSLSVLYNNLHNKNHGNQESNTSGHSIAYKQTQSGSQLPYEEICSTTPALCQIIQNTLSDEIQRDTYNQHTAILLNKINTILSKKYPSITSGLRSIIIKNETGGKRGYSNHNAIVINIDTLGHREYNEVLTHEIGHIIDLGIIEGYTNTKNTIFTEFDKAAFSINDTSLLYYAFSRESERQRKKEGKKQDFCTIYGMTNPFEDFAECFNLYLNHNDYFNTIKKSSNILDQKYEFMKALFDNQYISTQTQSGVVQSPSYRYWDSTRLYKTLVK